MFPNDNSHIIASSAEMPEEHAINADMGMLWMLLSGILVFFIQAGFTLVESGMTRSKNAVNIGSRKLFRG